MHIKTIIISLAVILSINLSTPTLAQTTTIHEQIATLLNQIEALQKQLALVQTPSTRYTFTRDLGIGSEGEEVKQLQIFLNKDTRTKLQGTGPGTPGFETTYFGPKTAQALIVFQNLYAKETLAPAGLSQGTGYFGALTRKKFNQSATINLPLSTIPPSKPTSSTTDLVSGDKVYIETLGSSVSVYRTPNGSIKGRQYKGVTGITLNSTTIGKTSWWEVDFDRGTDGWVMSSVLKKGPKDTKDTTDGSSKKSNRSGNQSGNQPTPAVTLTASAPSIPSGNTVTLTWTSSNVTACTGTNFTSNTTNGSTVVTPTQTTSYTIVCTGSGGTVTESVTVTVVINQEPDTTAPTVSLTTPTSGTTYTTAQTVTITASASDNVGVTRVEFYRNGVLQSTDTTSPFTHAWSITSAQNGTHSWTARAYDAVGNSTLSAVVSVEVGVSTNPSASVHDFTGLPLTADGWTDLHGMVMSQGYSDARIVYVSTSGNDSTAQVYNPSSAALGGQPLNPTGTIAPYSTLAAAYNQLRDGYPDVMLLRRGDSWGSSSVTVNKAGRNNLERMIVGAYGSEAVARPIARVISGLSANHVVLSSVHEVWTGTGASAFYRGSNVLVEDFMWQGPAGSVNEVAAAMLNGGTGELGGGTIRRSSASWVVFFAGDWDGAPQTPSRFEENTISRGVYDSGKSNIYFAEGARNIQSIRNQSLLTPRAGWRQRHGGIVRETVVMGVQPGLTWGGGFDVMDALTFENNLSMHFHGPHGMNALNNATVSGNIFTAFTTPANDALFLRPDYQGLLGGWRGANVVSNNIFYSPVSYGVVQFESGIMDVFAPGATLAFDNNDFINSGGGRVTQVMNDARVTFTNNKYYSSATTNNWFSGRTYEQMISSTGEVFAPSNYPDPDRNIVTYMQSIGANPSSVDQALEWYSDGVPGNPSLVGALSNRRGAWDERFTSISLINYIRAGFGLDAIPTQGQVLGSSDFKFVTDLSLGMENEDVKKLQARLRSAGHFNFPIDTGYFGQVTFEAMKAYQAANGIPNTGFMGPLTRASLNK